MKERPIIFSGPMVRALLDGRKTQTRRIVKLRGNDGLQLDQSQWRFCEFHDNPRRAVWQHTSDIQRVIAERCRYGVPGDRLWVREPWQAWTQFNHLAPRDLPKHTPNYLADGNMWDARYRHARFMPRWASRIALEITDVRVQRVQEISEEDAKAEGVERGVVEGYWRRYCANPEDEAVVMPAFSAHDSFESLWDSINAKKHPWSSNPWVWAVSFKRISTDSATNAA